MKTLDSLINSIVEPTVIVITGPTASGKSALAIDVARRLDTEIISADSRQIYKGIPIVTAMPSPEELEAVPHHFINILPLDAYYSAADFESEALRIIRDILPKKEVVVVCGGSMLYVDALCNGIDNLPSIPSDIRQYWQDFHLTFGNERLLQELLIKDPEYFNKVDRNNIKRVIHALEIISATGGTFSSLRTGRKAKREFKILKICIDMPRPQLFERINRRVDAMVESGLEEEARKVFPLRHLNSLNTVGLKEMFAYFEGKMDFSTAVERIKKNTRVYAKKQMTWWKKDPDIIFVQD